MASGGCSVTKTPAGMRPGALVGYPVKSDHVNRRMGALQIASGSGRPGWAMVARDHEAAVCTENKVL